MEEFQLRDFFKELFSMKKIVCISVILSVIACAGIGYYRFKRAQTGDQKVKIETYEKSMKNFDEAIKGIEANINMTQAQVDVQQMFIDNALFLKIDSSNVQVAEISYIIETDLVGEEKNKGLTGIYANALDSGQVRNEIKKALPGYEGLVIDKDINIGHLKATLELFAKKMFGEKREIRLRSSYFPFTEPSVEVDITCANCGGKGCNMCKGTGYIEILGGGMVHPNVLKMNGYDPEEYSGFAFGIGIERVAILRYGIDDIRKFYNNDVRFLHQFKKKA